MIVVNSTFDIDFFDMRFYVQPKSSSTDFFNKLIASDFAMPSIIQQQ